MTQLLYHRLSAITILYKLFLRLSEPKRRFRRLRGWKRGEEHRFSLTEQTDGALAGLSSRGDKLAFETLMRRYLPLLGGYAACRAPSDADAEDAIQETMLAAWRSIAAYDGASTIKTWLIAILRRKLADIYRLRYRSDNIGLDELGDVPEEETPINRLGDAATLPPRLST